MKLFNQRRAKSIVSLLMLAVPLTVSATTMTPEAANASEHSTLSSPNSTNLAYKNIPVPEPPVTPPVEPEPPETMPVEPPELPGW